MLLGKSLFRETPKVLSKQTNKALFSLMKNLSYPNKRSSLMYYLFDALIKPVMDYGSEIWKFAITDNNESLEIIHRKFCKFTLGRSTNATNLAVYDELRCQYAEKFRWWNIGRDYVMKIRICLSIWEKPIYMQSLKS